MKSYDGSLFLSLKKNILYIEQILTHPRKRTLKETWRAPDLNLKTFTLQPIVEIHAFLGNFSPSE